MKLNHTRSTSKMLKSNPCPICHDTTIVITHDAGLDLVYPECFKCNYRGNAKYKQHMIIRNVEQEFQLSGRDPDKKQALMDFAKELWNETIGMQKLEEDPDYFGPDDLDDVHSDAFDNWMPVEDLVDDSKE